MLTLVSAGVGMLSLVVTAGVELIKRLGDGHPLRRFLHSRGGDGPPRP